MITLGNIRPTIQDRPGSHRGRVAHFVPNLKEYDEYWAHLYSHIAEHAKPQRPLGNDNEHRINPFFGFFGKKFHPSRLVPDYFHVGVDFTATHKTPVLPMFDGILEYSGFAITNGHYVMLSHPEIITEDGFVLYTMYMHLRSTSVRFSAYQKMLREISLRTYPEIAIDRSKKIGQVGESGNAQGRHTHLHVQCEFRHRDGTVVAIDPAKILKISLEKNKTAEIKNPEEMKILLEDHHEEIHEHGIERYWEYID